MKYGCAFFVVICLAVCASLQCSHAQQINMGIFAEKVHIQFSLGLDGKVKFVRSGSYNFKPPFDGFELLKTDEVKKELELTNEQMKSLSPLFKQFEKDLAAISKLNREDQDAATAEYKSLCEQLEKKVNQVLLEFQRKRLNELTNRLYLRANGITKFIQVMSEPLEFKIPRSDLVVVDQKSKKLVEEWIPSCEEKCKKLLVEFRNKLPSELHDIVDERIEKCLPFHQLDLLDLASERAMKAIDAKNAPSNSSEKISDRLRRMELYELEGDGQWKFKTYESRFTMGITQWLNDPEKNGLGKLELTPKQIEQLSELSKEIRDRLEERGKKLNALNDSGAGPEEMKASSLEGEKIDQFAEKVFFEEILFKHQIDALNERVDRLDSERLGPFGIHSQYEKMSESKKAACREAFEYVREQATKLKKEATAFEQDMLEQSLSELQSEQRNKIMKAIGPKPKYLEASVYLMKGAYKVNSENRKPSEK
jgi:hypothetical protein